MTFYESVSKHEAFNKVLGLMNDNAEFRNQALFEAVHELAIKQGEVTDEILNNK